MKKPHSRLVEALIVVSGADQSAQGKDNTLDNLIAPVADSKASSLLPCCYCVSISMSSTCWTPPYRVF